MRRRAALLVALLCTVLAGCGGSASSPSVPTLPPGTGIDIFTVAGPTCPVQRVGQNCTRPIAARVEVRSSGQVVTTVQTAADGRAHVPLQPGDYTVQGVAESSNGGGLPRPGPAVGVTVVPGRFVAVQVTYDTGIR